MNSLLLQNREWLIQPDALHSMAASLRGFGDPVASLPQAEPPHPLLSVEDGIGVVAIDGLILRKPDLFARVFLGAISSEDIGDALRQAGERPDIKAVFLDIDSPGGTVAGTPELAAAVASLNARKPVYAFSSGLMCSAAYRLNAWRSIAPEGRPSHCENRCHPPRIPQVRSPRGTLVVNDMSFVDFN